MKVKIAKGECPKFLNRKKAYYAEFLFKFKGKDVYRIIDDRGVFLKISLVNSIHLGGGSWEIVDE